MSSKVDICNMALTRLAASRITNFNDGTPEANDCLSLYEMAAKYTMASGSWSSVIRRQTLSQLDETPVYEYNYVYQLPLNPLCLRVLSINEFKPGSLSYKIEGKKLYINSSSVSIKYLAYLQEASDYDIDLEEAIVDRLVAELVYKRTGSLSAYTNALKYAEEHKRELLSRSSMPGSSEDVNSDDYIDVRLGIFPNGMNSE